MFSLIITIISIALVAALALATLYYGGSAFSKGSAKADAAKILLQGQQLIGASELFQAGENRWPLNMQELQNSKYITGVPQAKAAVQSAIELASAAGTEWTMPKDSAPMFLLRNIASLDVCGYVNQQGSLKNKGVLLNAYPGLAIQCYGPATTLKVIIKKSTEADSLVGPLRDINPAEVGGALPPGVPECIADPIRCRNQWTTPPAGWDPTVWTQVPGGGTPPVGGGTDPGPSTSGPISVGGLHISYTSAVFPNTVVQDWSEPQLQPVLTNQSGADVILTNFSMADGTHFYADMGDCPGILAVNASCSLFFEFDPLALGALADTATLSTSAGSVSVSLAGKAIRPPSANLAYYDGAEWPLVSLAGGLDWGSVFPAAGTRTVYVYNREKHGLVMPTPVVSSGWVVANDGCSGKLVAPNGYCSLKVKLTGPALQAYTGSLSFGFGLGVPATALSLRGTVISGPQLLADIVVTGSHDMTMGTTYTLDVVYTNRGNEPINPILNNAGSVENGSYSSELQECGVLYPNESCTGTFDVTAVSLGTLKLQLNLLTTVYDDQGGWVNVTFGTGGYFEASVR